MSEADVVEDWIDTKSSRCTITVRERAAGVDQFAQLRSPPRHRRSLAAGRYDRDAAASRAVHVDDVAHDTIIRPVDIAKQSLQSDMVADRRCDAVVIDVIRVRDRNERHIRARGSISFGK